MRKSGAAILSVALIFCLPACAPEPDSIGQHSGEVESEQHVKSGDESTSGLVEEASAAISVAAVDPDGLNVTVSGFLNSLVREGQICTFSFTKDDTSIVRQSSTVTDRAASSCGQVTVPIEELGRGAWKVTLTVDVADIDVLPDSKVLEVP